MTTTRRGTHPVPDANPVRPHHLIRMAERYALSVYDRAAGSVGGGPEYHKAVRAAHRQHQAMLRLAEALERQSGGTR